MLGKIEGKRRRRQQMVRYYHQLNGHESEQTPGDSEGRTEEPGVLQSRGSQGVKHDLMTEQQQQRVHMLSCLCAVFHFIPHAVMSSRDGMPAPLNIEGIMICLSPYSE